MHYERIFFAKTGHSGLDLILDHLRLGDNVIWQVDSIDDYMDYARMFAQKSVEEGRKVIYIRFSNHPNLLEGIEGIKTYDLSMYKGFEDFTINLHNIIQQEGVLAFYIFDSLTGLLDYWASDLMISHFFAVTSKYLYELDNIAYFALIRNSHSHESFSTMREITQVLLDLYNMEGTIYIHPLKVKDRYSETMFLPHLKSGVDMLPLTSSSDTAILFSSLSHQSSYFAGGNLDSWDRMLIDASDLVFSPDNCNSSTKEKDVFFHKMLKLIIGRDEKILNLAKKYLTLKDLNQIGSRLISSGFIGGKAVGMLIARKILINSNSEKWSKILEPHDSFYIGSDVFYAYIIDNGLWNLYKKHRKKEYFFEAAKSLKEKFLNGSFTGEITEKIIRMLQYFGQSPIIIRSSSLLEDSYGNAFAGKYESFFLVNQGTLEERYKALEDAIRKIYSSTMGEDALIYRKKRGLEEKDEQMALIVQRVSGEHHGRFFFPMLAGVGFSKNTYIWDKAMSPEAGLLRLVFGLGTRAVDRIENDYSRIMALDFPQKQLLYGNGELKQYSQHYADVLDIQTNKLTSFEINELMKLKYNADISLIASPDLEANRLTKELGISEKKYWILTYKKLIQETSFVTYMSDMMKSLQEAYHYPVDIEFTANFTENGELVINLLQCRPLQTKGLGKAGELPNSVNEKDMLFKSKGGFMGGNINTIIDKLVYVDPKEYVELTETKKYQVARIIGKITKKFDENTSCMLIGPGRWGTTTASLGIPVSFSEINNVSVLCEKDFRAGGMSPELSYGSHFFQDLVEENIFYVAIFTENGHAKFNTDIINKSENLLTKLIPDESSYANVVKVISPQNMKIVSNLSSNEIICYLS